MLAKSTHLGTVTLYVRDLTAHQRFYGDLIGMDAIEKTSTSLTLGSAGSPLLILQEKLDLPFPARAEAGLYHTAFLFTSPSELAETLMRIAHHAPNLYEGSSDHLVSEAFYFRDPEGNGVELYLDRPRSEWQWENGQIKMGSEYIDAQAFIQKHVPHSQSGSISIGHIHLKVGDITLAQRFYGEQLGFDVVAKLPSALFVSAGGYHHHIGLNTWESLGAGTRKPSLGLASFTIINPTLKEDEIIVEDPWGIPIVIRKTAA